MIENSLDKKRRPRLKKLCSKCNKKFTPKGLGRSENLCGKCWIKTRSSKKR